MHVNTAVCEQEQRYASQNIYTEYGVSTVRGETVMQRDFKSVCAHLMQDPCEGHRGSNQITLWGKKVNK